MQKYLPFIQSQKIMAIAAHDPKDVWIANVYFGVDDTGTIFFVSSTKNRHSEMILKNPQIAFSLARFEATNLKNRKGIQGLGVCRPAKNPIEMAAGIKCLYKNLPDLREILTIEWITTNVWDSKIWILTPTYLKYWDDELYGDDESEEFFLDENAGSTSQNH